MLSKYDEFFTEVYRDGGAFDHKIKHLIALATSLAVAACDTWTAYCFAVAKETGATSEDLNETVAIAMAVGLRSSAPSPKKSPVARFKTLGMSHLRAERPPRRNRQQPKEAASLELCLLLFRVISGIPSRRVIVEGIIVGRRLLCAVLDVFEAKFA